MLIYPYLLFYIFVDVSLSSYYTNHNLIFPEFVELLQISVIAIKAISLLIINKKTYFKIPAP